MGKLAQYNAGENIMRAFGDKNPFERELIMTGMCFECQENVFSRPAPGNEEKWGSYLGECECCGAPIYEKKHAMEVPGTYKCNGCGTLYSKDESGLCCIED